MESSRTHSILNTAAAALFAVLLIAAITFSGVSDVALTHIFLVFAFGVGSVIVLVEIVPNKSRKQKAFLIGLLGIALFGFDRLLIYLKAANQGAAHSETTISIVPYLAALRGLHWQPLLVGIIIGSLVTAASLRVIVRRQRLTESRRLAVEKEAPKVEILSALDLWTVGWRQTVRGKVYPTEGGVQVLVRHPDGAWRVQATEVTGGLWTARCQFGDKDKPGMSYKIVAVDGDSLKQETYDDLPLNLIRSEIITVNRNSNEEVIDCPDKQLHQTKIDDKSAIKDLVMVCSIEPGKVTDKGAVHLEFRWVILNMSLYGVSVPSIAGFIAFHKNGVLKGYRFRIPPSLEDKDAAVDRAYRKEGCFIIRQDFQSSLEADDVLDSSPDSYYDFSNLVVALTGDGFETHLNTNYHVKKNEQWLPRGDCDFIYACLAERDAKIAKLEAALNSAREPKNE
jgi:hypothetical protein